MPSLPSNPTVAMSTLTWAEAARRVAGAVSLARGPDAVEAAKEALEETFNDWDTRRDWKFTQVIAPDITVSVGDTTFNLETNFKKPYVAYLVNNRSPLIYVERSNWHREAPGYIDQGIPRYYTLYNNASTATGSLMPASSVGDTMVLLYYRDIVARDDDNETLDIPKRWTGYILNGAKARLTLGKESRKADMYFNMYEAGIKLAKADDQRVPDQFVTFLSQNEVNFMNYFNPNALSGPGWGFANDWGI
jgi:hypothetical protein